MSKALENRKIATGITRQPTPPTLGMVLEIGNATHPCSERVTLVCKKDKHHLVAVVVEVFLDSLCRIESKIGF